MSRAPSDCHKRPPDGTARRSWQTRDQARRPHRWCWLSPLMLVLAPDTAWTPSLSERARTTIYPTFPDYILLDSRNAKPTARRRILLISVPCPNRLSLPDVARLRKQEEQAAAVHSRFTHSPSTMLVRLFGAITKSSAAPSILSVASVW